MATSEEVGNLRIDELKLNAANDGDGFEKNKEWKFFHQADEVENIVKDDEGNYVEESADKLNMVPMEIAAECLSCFMSGDYESALLYCGQILQYEPDNKTVQDFYVLIQQKIEIESENKVNKREESDSSEYDVSESEDDSESSNSSSYSTIDTEKSGDENEEKENGSSDYECTESNTGGNVGAKVSSKFHSNRTEDSSDDSM